MAGQLLLVNPARRRRRKNAMPAGLKRYWAARRGAKRKANPHRRARRRRNVMVPAWAHAVNPHRRHRARRRNPMHHAKRHVYRRRHRNPIPGIGGIVSLLKDAAIQSLGGVAVDYVYGYVNGMMPASMKRVPGSIGVGDAVKVVFTSLVGTMLSRPTRGLSRAAAIGSLNNDFRQMIVANLPATITQQLAWYQPAPVVQGTQWTGPNRGRMVRQSPLLSGRMGAFVRGSPTLSGAPGMPQLMPNVVSVGSGMPLSR
jgi:hypothetical protein